MELTDLYQKGEELLRQRDIGFLLDGVETGFILEHDRLILDRYTFKQQCIDATEANTDCDVLGLKLSTPVIMSANDHAYSCNCGRRPYQGGPGSQRIGKPDVDRHTDSSEPEGNNCNRGSCGS